MAAQLEMFAPSHPGGLGKGWRTRIVYDNQTIRVENANYIRALGSLQAADAIVKSITIIPGGYKIEAAIPRI